MVDNKESATSKICAFARAQHARISNNKVFDDYLALALLGEGEYEYLKNLISDRLNMEITSDEEVAKSKVIATETKTANENEVPKWELLLEEYISPIPLSRIAYTESKLLEFANQNSNCQYVICGAGLDSYAFRNNNPNIEIFELDHPSTQKHKIQRIKELNWNIPANVHFAPINFEYQSLEETLIKAGFDPEKKTFFSILGVSYYLTLDTFTRTIKNISKISGNESIIVFDYPDDISWKNDNSPQRVNKIRTLTEELGEKMTEGYSYGELEATLEDNGYQIVQHLSPKQIHETYFQDRTDNLRAYENVHFIEAKYANTLNQIRGFE